MLRDGELFTLCGLMKDSLIEQEKGIPFVKEIPGFGLLFKKKIKVNSKSQIVIFLTPRIMKGQGITPSDQEVLNAAQATLGVL